MYNVGRPSKEQNEIREEFTVSSDPPLQDNRKDIFLAPITSGEGKYRVGVLEEEKGPSFQRASSSSQA